MRSGARADPPGRGFAALGRVHAGRGPGALGLLRLVRALRGAVAPGAGSPDRRSRQGEFASESSAYRILKAADPIESPTSVPLRAAGRIEYPGRAKLEA